MQTLLDHNHHHHHHHHSHNHSHHQKQEGQHHSSNSDSLLGCGVSSGGLKRKPLQLLTGIFSRNKGNRRDGDSVSEGGEKSFYITDDSPNHGHDDVWGGGMMHSGGIVGGSCGAVVEDIPEPREALHSPYHAKTIDQDMENLRLSRQDNPYLQVLASRECLHDSDDGSEYEEKSLMAQSSKSSGGMNKDPLTLAEVHARLVRSPPPIMWTRNRNSEPSFALLSAFQDSSDDQDHCVFRFPPQHSHHHHGGMGMMAIGGSQGGFHRMMTDPSPTPTCRSHPFATGAGGCGSSSGGGSASCGGGGGRILDGCGLRFREKTLDDVTGKFNLSPQPRRRPTDAIKSCFSDFHS